jgi:pimeloyl-ACP methyl ester carboxylesterase
MKKIIPQIYLLVLFSTIAYSQTVTKVEDQNINNLVHTMGYKTSELGAMPQYVKVGKGRQTIILIPGWGFDVTVFEDFMEANKNNYTMYAITIPGYGNTMAPPMPDTSISYGEQTWNKGVLEGIEKLIKNEKIIKPVIAGHATQGTQLALRMAIDYPEQLSGVIILGGHAKFISIIQGKPTEYPLKSMIASTDMYTAPIWFKGITKKDFDDGNYLPGIYSLDSIKGADLWKQSAKPPLPVLVHYICEFFASDIKTEIDKIKCPVLILRATFNNEVLDAPINNYVKPQFIDSWNNVSEINYLIEVQDIKDAGLFIWKDNPKETYKAINNILKQQ